MGMMERGGELRAAKVTSTKARDLQPNLFTNVEPGSKVYTDEWLGYMGIERTHQHETANHAKGEYVRGAAHTNTIEGGWFFVQASGQVAGRLKYKDLIN